MSVRMRVQYWMPYHSVTNTPWYGDERWKVYGGRVTLHGLSMLFFFLMGVWYGYAGNVYVPLELGRMDLVFSRSNVISLWMFMAAYWLLIAGGHSGCTCSDTSLLMCATMTLGYAAMRHRCWRTTVLSCSLLPRTSHRTRPCS